MNVFRLCLLMIVAVTAAQPIRAADSGIEFFENKIRPVLIEHCFPCHSHQTKMTKAGLALDSAAGWKTGGDSGPAIVPGKPAESLLLKALSHADDNLKMPPKGKLPAAIIADFEKWIALGAPDPRDRSANSAMTAEQAKKWWAFQPYQPQATSVTIDSMIQRRLTEKNLVMNSPVDDQTFVRRLYLDLWGLPPTRDQVHEFVTAAANNRAKAIDTLVDRMLASHHFGERWARHWLDVARFGESSGYEHDNDRPHAWQYRDFVIRALQQDLPFDKFVQWQIAGDEIAPNEPMAWHATGFLAAGLMNGQVTEREALKERYEVFDDWIGSTGTAFLGLTIGCARCHDHKFDAISTADYYRLAAHFTSAVRVNLNVPRDPHAFARKRAIYDMYVNGLRENRRRFEATARAAAMAWHAKSPEPPAPPWLILTAEEYRQGKTKRGLTTGHELTRQADGSYLFTRLNGDVGPIVFTARSELDRIQYLRLEALPDESLPNFGPGFGNFGDFRVTVSLTATPLEPGSKSKNIKLEKVVATMSDKPGGNSWGVDRKQAGQYQAVVLKLSEPINSTSGSALKITLTCPGDSPSARQTIGRFRIAIACIDSQSDVLGPAMEHSDYVEGLRDLRGPIVTPAVVRLYCLTNSQWNELDQAVRAAQCIWKPSDFDITFGVTESPTPYRMMIQGPDVYDQAHILKRGDPGRPGSVAEPAVVPILKFGELDRWYRPPPVDASTSHRRAALARWMTDEVHGAGMLTARVIVNRIWQHHFGQGIVATPSDFGAQGDAPTHPELIEYLARELIAHRWSLKHVHKLILSSAVYQQSSATNEKALQIDPANRLWWRYPPRRLEGEAIRDSLLAVSGRLDPTPFGPGTLDEKMTRRSIYFTVKRSRLIPALVQWDWPEALTSVGRRNTTVVPTQSLWMLNNPEVRSCAQALADQVKDKTDDEAIQHIYQRCLNRSPTAKEIAKATEFLQAGSERQQQLADLVQTVFMMPEFMTIR